MNLRTAITTLFVLLSTSLSWSVSAENDVYGTVSEVVARSGESDDTSVYIRLDVIEENSVFADCVLDGATLAWELDLTSPVAQYQYGILQKSYLDKLPVRIVGQENICDNGDTNVDKIYELSPWAWDILSPAKAHSETLRI